MANVMSVATRIVHGRGAVRELAAELKRAGAQAKVLVVTDGGVMRANLLRFVVPLLEQAGLKTQVFADVQAGPTEKSCLDAAAAFKSAGADAVVGVGGGSALDAARAVALLANHDGPLAQYDRSQDGGAKITQVVPPFVTVPTSAGGGSELSSALRPIVDGTALDISAPGLVASCALLDAELAVGLPPHLTGAGGFAALLQNLEALVAKGDNPLADTLALEGLRRGALFLKKAVTNGKDLEAREQLQLSAAFGGLAAQKGVGAGHALVHALFAVAGTPHAIAAAILTPAIAAFVKMGAEEKLAQAAVALGADPKAPAAERAGQCAALLEKLRTEVGLPKKLAQAGVGRDKLAAVVEKAAADGAHASSPRACGEVDFERLVNEAF